MAWIVDEEEKEQGQKYQAPSTGAGWVPDTDEAVPFEESKTNYPTIEDMGARIAPMLKNLPKSTARLGIDMAKTMGNLPATMKSLGQVAAGGVEKLLGTGTGEHIPNWDAFTQGIKDRYGSLGNLYKTMETDPAGFMTDVSAVLGGAGAVTRSGALSRAGKATNLLYGTSKGAGKLLGEAQNYAAGILSGGSPWEMRVAKKPSSVFTDYLRGSKNAENVIKEVDAGLKTIKKGAQAEFGAMLEGLEKSGATVDVTPIYKSFENLLKRDGIIRNPDGSFKFMGTKYEEQPSAQRFIKSLDNTLYNEERALGRTPYQFVTPTEAHTLKQTMDNIVNSIPDDAQYAQGFGKTVATDTSKALKEQLPQYAEADAKYAKMLDYERKMRESLGMKTDKPSAETVESKMKGAASRKYRRDLFQSYKEKTGFDLPAAVAGMDLSGAYPRGLWARGIITYFINQGIVDPKFLAATPYAVPRVSGELLQAQGRMGGKIMRVLPSQTGNVLYEAGQVREKSKPKSVLYGGD